MATIDDLLDGPAVVEDINEALYINPITRMVEVPDTELILGAEHDDRGECKYFRIPKVVGNNVQVSACSLRVYYTNASGDSDYFPVTNCVDADDCVVFCWELSKKVTAAPGRVKFSICVCRVENDVVQKEWNTTDTYGTVLPNTHATIHEEVDPTPDVIDRVERMTTEAKDAAARADLSAKSADDAAYDASVHARSASGAANIASEAARNASNSASAAALAATNAKADADRAAGVVGSVAEMPKRMDVLEGEIDTLRGVVSKFHSNIVEEAKGDTIVLDDSSDMELAGLKVFGKTEQRTTTGKNLLDIDEIFPVNTNVLAVERLEPNTIRVYSTQSESYASTKTPMKLYRAGKTYTVSCNVDKIVSGSVWVSLRNASNVMVNAYNPDTPGKYTFSYTPKEDIELYFSLLVTHRTAEMGDATFSNLQIEEGSIATAYEPYTGGVPSPNPDYPQDLKSVGESVNVTVRGKNLIDITKAVAERASMELKSDNEIRVYSDNTTGVYKGVLIKKIVMRAGQSYTLSADVKSVARNAGIALRRVADSTIIGAGAWCNVAKTLSLTRTVDADTEAFVSLFVCGAEAGSGDNTYANVQVELGSTATAYESYKDGGSLTLSTPNGLPGIPVDSGGTYTDPVTGKQWICDEVDFEKGVYVQRVQAYHFADASEWVIGHDGSQSAGTTRIMRHFVEGYIGTYGLSNYTSKKSMWAYDANELGLGNVAISRTALYLSFGAVLTIEEINAMFAENPLEIQLILANPIFHNLSEIDPDALAQYVKLHTNYPNTTVFNDVGAGMEVKYVADTQLYVDNKFKALEAAIANLI